MIMIANPIIDIERWQDLCRHPGRHRTDSSGRRAVYSQVIADQRTVAPKALGLIKGFIRSGNSGINILLDQRRNTNTHGYVGCHALVKHVRNFKVVHLLANTFGGSLGLLGIDRGQQKP